MSKTEWRSKPIVILESYDAEEIVSLLVARLNDSELLEFIEAIERSVNERDFTLSLYEYMRATLNLTPGWDVVT